MVGTIAGDDTILVIAPDNPTAEAVQEKLLGLLEEVVGRRKSEGGIPKAEY